ncbi:MAG: hypothetical protein ACOVVP_00135 [Pseudanabaena sp.]|jgi:hypothetical protein
MRNLITKALLTWQVASPTLLNAQELSVFADANLDLRMGQGYTTIGGVEYSKDLANCVENSSRSTFGDTSGERISIFVDSITSTESLTKNLSGSIDFSAGFSPMTGGDDSEGKKVNIFSAGIKGNQNNKYDLTYNSKYTYVFVEVRKEFQTEILSSFNFSDANLEYFEKDPQQFYSRCGDRFVSGVRKGSEVVAILRCETTSFDEKTTLDRFVKANAGYKGFTAEGEVKNILSTIKTATSNKCQMLVSATGGSGIYDVKDSDGFVSSAIRYVGASTQSTARAIDFITTSYYAILNIGLKDLLDRVDLRLVSQRKFVETKKNSIYEMLSLIDLFGNSTVDQSDAIESAIKSINQLYMQIDRCLVDLYNPVACRDENTGPRLPPGVIIRPPQK